MRRQLLALILLAVPVSATAAQAQSTGLGYTVSADLGLGVTYGPAYPGADKDEASPWAILRNGSVTRGDGAGGKGGDGLSFLPSFNHIGRRDAGDHDALTGMDDIGHAGEVGLRANYDHGPARGYLALRQGFGGHDGLNGQFGAKYRFQASDRLILWTGAEARFGSSDFTETYFGVTPDESAASGYRVHTPDGGVYAASLGLEARYALTPDMALLGEVQYTRLLGDAADSPLVESKGQPSIRLGIVRRFEFRF